MNINLDKYADRMYNEQLFYELTDNKIKWDECLSLTSQKGNIVYFYEIELEEAIKLLRKNYTAQRIKYA